MIQELIAYMLIGSAVTIAFIKIKSKLTGKKKKQKIDFKNESFSMQHNCSDCSADCILRDASPTILENNKELCNTIEAKSNNL